MPSDIEIAQAAWSMSDCTASSECFEPSTASKIFISSSFVGVRRDCTS